MLRHPRFHAAFAAGLAAAVLARGIAVSDRILIGADLFFATYLLTTAVWLRGRDGPGLRRHFDDADEGLGVIGLLALGAVCVSLYAIVETLLSATDPGALRLRPVLALAAVPLGWATMHTVMAFHYARLFYVQSSGPGTVTGTGTGTGTGSGTSTGADSGGLDFPGGCRSPGPWEFLYYSFTLGMCAQTSDVGLTSTPMRRMTLAHSVLSYFYNAVIVALAVNAGMALGQGG